MNGIASGIGHIWRVMVVAALGTGFLAGAPASSQAQDEPPLDLAALILHSDDLDWLVDDLDLVEIEGYPYGTWFSASHTALVEARSDDMYAPGRGALDLTRPAGGDVVAILDDTTWIRTQAEFMILPEPGNEEDQWSVGVGVSIEEFADEDGAEEAFNAFNDEDLLIDLTGTSRVTRLDAPSLALDVPAVMWTWSNTRWGGTGELLTLWAQMDSRIVSVAFYSADHGLPDPDVMVSLLDLQLTRLVHAEHLHQPNLSSCAPRFEGSRVLDEHEEYDVLNGQAFSWIGTTTYEDLADFQGEIEADGIVHSYSTTQRIAGAAIGAYSGTLWFAGKVRTFTDEGHAEAYLRASQDRLDDNYDNVEEIDDLPGLGDGAVAFNYDGPDNYPASIILFQDGATVYSIRLGSMTEYQPETVIDLAEAQVERLANGDCDTPLEVPGTLR